MEDKKATGIKYSKIVVLIIILLNMWFANKVLDIYLVQGTEPQSLIVAWFAFTTGELALIAGIKRKEVQNEKENNRYDDRI